MNIFEQILTGVWLNVIGGSIRIISTFGFVHPGGRYPIVFVGNGTFLQTLLVA